MTLAGVFASSECDCHWRWTWVLTGSVFRLLLQLNLLVILSPEPHRPIFSLVCILGAHPSQLLPCFYVFGGDIVRLAVLLMHVKSVSNTEHDFSHFWGNLWSRCSFHDHLFFSFFFFWLNTSLKSSPVTPWPGHLLVSDRSESKKASSSSCHFMLADRLKRSQTCPEKAEWHSWNAFLNCRLHLNGPVSNSWVWLQVLQISGNPEDETLDLRLTISWAPTFK